MAKKKTIQEFQEMKAKRERIVGTTASDYITARIAEEAGFDRLLVGDSLGMCVYGYKSTTPVTMDMMVAHCQAVRRGAPNTFIIGDLPFGSYEGAVDDAVKNAVRLYKEADVDCVKLEGGRQMIPQIKAIIDAGMSVMGHIGLTPQRVAALGGFRVQGRTADAALELLADAQALQAVGVFAMVLEAVPPEPAKLLTDRLQIPVGTLGSGPHGDMFAILSPDMLGLFDEFTPKYVKKYANLAEEMRKAFRAYIDDVRGGRYPTPEHAYKMKDGEAEKLERIIADYKK